MKTSKIIFLFSLIALASIFSCNDDDDADGITTGDCFASWTMDGVDFNEDNMALCVYLDNTLNLSTTTTGGPIQLQIDPITSTGTYIADPTNPDINVVIILRLEDGRQLGISSGQIVVNELSNAKTKGTFNGKFFDIMDITQSPDFTVTNGIFEANF